MKRLCIGNLILLFLLTLTSNYLVNGDEDCKLGAIDLVFVMDQSGSVGADNFKVALTAAVNLVDTLDIGTTADKSRVGFVRFNSKADVVFTFDEYTDNQAVHNAIMSVNYSGGNTNIAAGMNTALKDVFIGQQRLSVPNIMLLITDGNDKSNVTAERQFAEEHSISIYALGVTNNVDTDELIAATGDRYHVFTVGNFSQLTGAMQNVCREIAPSAPVPTQPPQLHTTSTAPQQPPHEPKSCNCEGDLEDKKYWLDIVFVVDSTDGVSQKDFEAVDVFLNLMAYINIDQTGDPQYTRVGVINTADTADRIVNLTSVKSGAELTELLNKDFSQKGGDSFNAQAGLQAASDMFEEEESAHRRENIQKVVVVFSSHAIDCKGKKTKSKASVETNVLCELVSIMKGNGVVITTVGMMLAGETEFPYIDIADDCNQLDNTASMMEDLLNAFCRANCYCLEPYSQFVGEDSSCEKYAECVYVHGLSLSTTGATETCSKENSIVTPILNEKKNEFMSELHLDAGFFPFWVGMTCNETQCAYSDGTKLTASDYTNWCISKGQPDYTKGDCVYEDQCNGLSTAWFSGKCGRLLPTHYFSCQKETCSVDNYCDYSSNSKISTSNVQRKKHL